MGSQDWKVLMVDTDPPSKTPVAVGVLPWTCRSERKRPSRYTGRQSSHHKWLVSRKIWSVEQLEASPGGINRRTSHHRPPGGDRRGKRKRPTIFFETNERTREGHRRWDEHWNRFKGNVGETSERRCGAHMGFSERIDTILNWTELAYHKHSCTRRVQQRITNQ